MKRRFALALAISNCLAVLLWNGASTPAQILPKLAASGSGNKIVLIGWPYAN